MNPIYIEVGVEILDWTEVRSDAFRELCEAAK